jgi:putative membrane protein
MKLRFMLAAAAALTSTVAISSPAQAQRGEAMMFVAKAGASDLYEIQSSQIAMRRARDPRVRAMAGMLVRDHRRTTMHVTAAARASGLRPRAPMLEPMQRRMIAELNRTPAGRFDQVWLAQQVPAHEQALELMRTYSTTGDAPALRRAASGAIPIVEGHLAHARRLQR